MWVDIAKGYVRKWADAFRDLEQNHGLNVEVESHIWLLHHIFLASINRDALEWANAWNSHGMRLPHGERSGRSPKDLWLFGMAEHGARGLDAIGMQHGTGVNQEDNQTYEEDPANYGVDWEGMDDEELTRHHQ
jgi:hypothetical protein